MLKKVFNQINSFSFLEFELIFIWIKLLAVKLPNLSGQAKQFK